MPTSDPDGSATDLLEALAAAVAGRVLTDPASTEAYRRDQCLVADAGRPLAVVRAAGVDDVVAVLRLADEHRVPVVTRGAGSGLAGAANAVDDGLVLDVSGLDALSVDPVARTATVGPGVVNLDLDTAARAHGLFYAPDPGSRAYSSIGGNLATNAGGMCCAKYGVTADHALALTVVLPGGEVVRTGRTTRKDVVGLDLTRLLVGSEGTLGVVVEATVRLLPVPARTATAVLTFRDAAAAVDAVLAIGTVTTPSAVELMDATTVRAVNAMTRMGLDETPTLLVQCDGSDAAAEIAAVAALAQRHGALEVLHSDDEEEGRALMEARRVALTALERQGTVLLDDVCVPVHRLPELLGAIETAARAHGVLVGTFGHAADGNLHPTIVFDPASPGAAEAARACFDAIVDAALALDGTVSGEHGVGVLKAPYVARQVGAAEQALMRRVRAAFDPHGIMNPGRGY
ncbi:FAD-linked oxidase C-terminal domain-containing protein [Nocardioides zeae]|uniref:FAD-linked oxidase C-terminal domain-containing protein n=1 Tax=Nocardioides imazamoxiresistens TaxID=3231893 RepID=A0ABU3Q0I3_9ACTN|nr:FAD-linked oxidase C-terminal domain-containing protein [Nocardioides zeae]MDT9595025.1 FAD-linked oxidase C-terminal domain-containing protein [Nocardioides zeae]